MGDLIGMMERAGFVDAEYAGETGISTSALTVGALFRARKSDKTVSPLKCP